eukprot:3441902-Pyramimonas_sp.AAC.1
MLHCDPASATCQTARKFAVWFRDGMTEAAETGLLDDDVYSFLQNLSLMWFGDTQEIEGCNSIVKHVGRLAPNISLPLLSSRITIKKAVAKLALPME